MRIGLAMMIGMAACGRSAEPDALGSSGPSCLADQVTPPLRRADLASNCGPTATPCAESCSDGDAEACVLHAYGLQRQEKSAEAQRYFLRGCQAGLAIACTNYAAELWVDPPTQADLDCAERLFTLSCDVGEPFGCAMGFRMRFSRATTEEDFAALRADQEQSCESVGGFVCRMYAVHLESGRLGDVDPGLVRRLMERACDTGDREACGSATGTETLR